VPGPLRCPSEWSKKRIFSPDPTSRSWAGAVAGYRGRRTSGEPSRLLRELLELAAERWRCERPQKRPATIGYVTTQADLPAARKPAGHFDPATTARYDRHGERAMREAASHLHVPHFCA
jgi:hypothetical protein